MTLPGGGGGSSAAASDQISPLVNTPSVLPSRLPIALAFAIALVALLLAVATSRTGPAALRRLPGREREALAERTLLNLRDICQGSDRPREFCKEQANLLLALPECGEVCQSLARSELLADMPHK